MVAIVKLVENLLFIETDPCETHLNVARFLSLVSKNFVREELASLPVFVGEANAIQRLIQDSYLCFVLRTFLSLPCR
jgi:hypothetical protein